MHAFYKRSGAFEEKAPSGNQAVLKTLFSLPQFALTSGQIGQCVTQKHSRISYVEVEILDAHTKKKICVLEKMLPSFTIADVKQKFYKTCPQWYPSRVGLLLESNGPLLKETKVIKNLAASSIITLYFRDLGTQIKWTTVFLTEYSGPLLLYLLFYFRLPNLYDTEDTMDCSRPAVVHLACLCHSLHYIKQILETLFLHSFSSKNTTLKNMLWACAFYWGFTIWMAYYINHPLYTPPSFGNRQIIPALVCFLMGAWISFTIMTQTFPVAVFALMVSLQLILWAQRKHHKYQKNLKHYPSYRTALIPFVL